MHFASINSFGPILHKGFLIQQLQQEPENEGLLAVVLLVCALGSRVLAGEQADIVPEDNRNTHPPGWEYFEQVEPLLDVPTFAMPSLYDVQMFIVRSSTVEANHNADFSSSWLPYIF